MPHLLRSDFQQQLVTDVFLGLQDEDEGGFRASCLACFFFKESYVLMLFLVGFMAVARLVYFLDSDFLPHALSFGTVAGIF